MSIMYDLLGPVAKWGLTVLSRRRLPLTNSTLALPGLGGAVEVFRDRWGIPHIYASSFEDLCFAQGLTHAQDRMWQMELNRRTAQGRLSELFGELALDTDRAVRTFGFNRLGEADLSRMGSELRSGLEAYAAGVNAFLQHPSSRLPVEFSLLRHRPEPWRPEDTSAFMRLMIWELSHAWYGEIVRAQMIEAVGEERAAELEIQCPDTIPAMLPDGIEFQRLGADGSLLTAKGPFLDRGKGSNAWAISGSRSATGKAFLCNDMHLALSMPGLWYAIHLQAGDLHVAGVSLPGAPLVLVGHNARIAWGMTLAFTDCEDLFVEQFDPESANRYRFRDEWLEAEVIAEVIKVKGRPEPHIEEVVVTRHGPVISDVVNYAEHRVAVNSMALRPGRAPEGWLQLNKAGNWDEFVEAMRFIEAPQLNVAYADVDGNIGTWVTGKVPVRAKGDGMLPAPGWNGEYEWVGEVPFEEMPHALNPSQGYVVNCNHCLVPDDYPHFLGTVWMNGYRATRVVEVLTHKSQLGVDDFEALQLDLACLPGRQFAALLEGLESTDADVRLALEQLRGWDGRLTTDSTGGAVYEVARYAVVRNLVEPGLGTELTNRFMGLGFHPLLHYASEFYGHDTVVMLRLLENPDSWWVQQAGGREVLLSRSLKQAVAWLRSELGPNPQDWHWGRIHRAAFEHPLGLQKPLDRVFNRGPFAIGGDTDTVCQTAMGPEDPYDNKVCAPSFRQIVDLGDLSRSVAMHPPGQSGHLASPHYDDLIEPWLKGEYYPMLWTREQVEDGAVACLRLTGEA